MRRVRLSAIAVAILGMFAFFAGLVGMIWTGPYRAGEAEGCALWVRIVGTGILAVVAAGITYLSAMAADPKGDEG